MAALFMKPLDDAMKKTGLFYVRFMDDWLVIAPTRWKLRKAVRVVNEVLESLMLEKHPDKTFIGRAVRGFSFLGYYLTPGGISVGRTTVDKMQEQVARLYEQGAGASGIGQYVRRWVRWVFAGMRCGASVIALKFHEAYLNERSLHINAEVIPEDAIPVVLRPMTCL